MAPSNQQQTNAILFELSCCAAEVIQYKHNNNNLECVSLFDRQAVLFCWLDEMNGCVGSMGACFHLFVI